MRILGIERDQQCQNQIRIIQPLYKLREHGLADILTIHENEFGTDYAVEKVLEADILVFQRPSSEEWFKFIKKAQKFGKLIVVDYDDDPFNTSPMNPYYKFIGTKEYAVKWPSGEVDMLWKDGVDGFSIEQNIMRQDLFNASFRKADMVTTTNPILQGFFQTLNHKTVVLPNLIDFNLFKKYDMVKKEVRIGYQSGNSHFDDICLVINAIKEVLKRNDNAKFVYMGDCHFENIFADIPRSRFEYHSWVQYIAYPYQLALLNLDIGICPLVDNVFNRNKSSIKYLDYSAVGAATVASDMPPYTPDIKSGENGLLVKNEKEWIEALDLLVDNEVVRKKIADNAYQDVLKNHNADTKAYLWKDAYESLIKQEVCV